MKKTLLAAFAFISFASAYSQIGIGTNTPNPSARLDITATNKGLLIPRIGLTGTGDIATISSPATSLLIYNTATAGAGKTAVTPGFYFYNGTAWSPLTTSGTAATGGWLTTGNAGTNGDADFIGTSDLQPINFRVNNIAAGHLNPSTRNAAFGIKALASNTTGYNNVAIGASALEKSTTGYGLVAVGDSALFNQADGSILFYNTAVGSKALFANTSGYFNTAVGSESLTSNNSAFNTAVGAWALRANTFGSNNVSVGTRSMENNISGDNNTAVGTAALHNNKRYNNTAVGYQCLYQNEADENTATGYTALQNNTTGTKNSAFGLSALLANNTGSYNTAVGYSASWKSKGNWNTAVGYNAMYNTDAGQANVAIGVQALLHNTTGSNNTAVGTNAGPAAGGTAYSNSTAIGQAAAFTASNQVRLGNTLVTAIGGYADFVKISDIRFKKNIQPETHGLDFIMKLEPIVYNMDMQKLNKFVYGQAADSLFKGVQQTTMLEKENNLISGFSAQQVEAVSKEIGYNFSGVYKPQNQQDHYSLAYAEFVVPLVKAVQEQQQMITDQHAKIIMQEKLASDQQKVIDTLLQRMDAIEKNRK